MNMRPKFEKLEDRILLDAEPTVTVDGPDAVNIGDQNVTYTLTFDNTSGDDTPGDPNDGDPGFKPFVDVILPQGADGDDGITFENATFLGTPLTPVELEFAPDGTVEHPFAVDNNGDPIVVTGTPGDTLLVFQLPYGSFAPNQAPVDIELTLDYSNLADLDVPLPIQARGGFESGNDPLDDPTNDPTILGTFDSLVSEQKVFNLTKLSDAAEEETATGPNFPRTYTLSLDVATGQELDNILIEDFLPNSIVYLGNLTVTGVD
ncbi:MAG: LEPR-XLL domain-containing protein, partial [Pseudomonadota bacterium]